MSDVTKLSRKSPAAKACVASAALILLTLSYFLWVYYPTMSVSASRVERSASAMASDAPQQPPVTAAQEAPPPAGDAHPAPKPAAEQTGTTQQTEVPERKPNTEYEVVREIVLKSVFDDAEFYRHVRKDIETHPLLRKLDLGVHIVKIENGYTTLAPMSYQTDLALRMERQEFSALFDSNDPLGGRQDIKALLTLAEAIKKNPSCKGVFWEEIQWVKARRLFHEALRALDDEIGTTKANWPQVLGNPKTASMIGKALSGDYMKRNAPPPEWLEKFEVALKEFPAEEQTWKQLKGRLVVAGSDEEIDRVLQDLQKLQAVAMPFVRVADPDGIFLGPTRDWRGMAYRIEQMVRGTRNRVLEIAKLLAKPTRAVFSVHEDSIWGSGDGIVLVHSFEEGDRENGWVIGGVTPPLPQAPAALLDSPFRPVNAIWWDIEQGTLTISQRVGGPFDALYQEENNLYRKELKLDFFQVGLRSYQTKGGTIHLKVLTEGTDADLLKRIPFPARPAGHQRQHWFLVYPNKMDREDLISLLDGLKITIGVQVKLRDGLTYFELLEGFRGTPRRRRVLAPSEKRLYWKCDILANDDNAFVHAVTDLLREHRLNPSGHFLLVFPAEVEERFADLEWRHLVEAHATLEPSRIRQTLFHFEKRDAGWRVGLNQMELHQPNK